MYNTVSWVYAFATVRCRKRLQPAISKAGYSDGPKGLGLVLVGVSGVRV